MITYEQALHRWATKRLNLPTPPLEITIDVFSGYTSDEDDDPQEYFLIKWLTEDGKRSSISINLRKTSINTIIREIIEESIN